MSRSFSSAKGLLFVFLFFFVREAQAGAAKKPVRAQKGMVVSAHYLASQVGVDILKKGGNAVDAAVATGMALAVVHPAAGNIGGGGFMIVVTKDGQATAFDFREKAPAMAHEKMYVDSQGKYIRNLNHEGYLAVGVPGTVAGFDLALRRFGRKSWKELAAPAVRLAENGFSLNWALAEEFKQLRGELKPYPASLKAFYRKDGTAYEAGDVWKQPDLAKSLKRIQDSGRDGFYKGQTARLLAADMRKNGGLITEADLASYEAKERSPLRGSYRGFEVISMCPPSSGGTALIEMLNILEGFDLKSYGHNSAQYLHVLTESMRRAYADRALHVGDPDFIPEMPIDKLISKEYAEELRRNISLTHSSKSNPEKFNEAYESSQTTHYSVVDAEGNAVVVTYTLEDGYGSKIVAEGLGFLLNNEMGDFNPAPGRTDTTGMIGTKPNLVSPGKRMLSSMTPTIIVKDGKPWALIGSPGGRTIINTVLQVTLNLIDFSMNISEAITAGRVHHQWLPDVLRIEKFATTADTYRLLEGIGHRIDFTRSQGSVMGIMIEDKTFFGASDPRQSDGAAIGY
ncbi:MAG: gamma-glutamyltransferase [Ignavibacteriales bacterium]|nr:gamma-glutamyltransferase [Ignavibacteriales bacterium]